MNNSDLFNQLTVVDSEIENLQNWKKDFIKHIKNIDDRIMRLKNGRRYLITELLQEYSVLHFEN